METNKNNNDLVSFPQVVYEDNHILVVFKPHRLLVQGDDTGHPTLFLHLCLWLKEKYQKPGNVYLGMIHRLDRPAAGILVFAKTSKSASRLSEQVRLKKMGKKYQAIVQGKLSGESGHCIHFLSDPGQGRAQVFPTEREGTKKAELYYKVLERKESATLIEIDLITGRRHQIRAQMAHLGHPLVGDIRYGSQMVFREGAICLVASQISVEHPTSHQILSFELPRELNTVLEYWKNV